MRIITQSDVERLLPIDQCVGVMRQAMMATSQRNVTLPIRQFMPVPEGTGKLAIMPGTLGDPACFGIKLVCKYDRPHDDPLGTHVGMVMLFDSVQGIPLAMIEGSSLTAIRTSAASALATDLLANNDASRLAILGNGEQAMRHLYAMQAVRDIAQVKVWGRDIERTQDFVQTAAKATGLSIESATSSAAAIADADIICTTTAAKQPIIFGKDLQPGQHINLVGSAIPTTAEMDDDGVARARFFVDYREAAMAAAGELLGAIERKNVTENHIVGEIGAVAAGHLEGRQQSDEITIYKSLGVASQDLAAAHGVWQRACAQDRGLEVDLLA
ncbi:MAG: ornithine cyclodeaminase family protein [Parasphingorhabdus sp.]|uniref:ornithine cyclodeaminase family protein n=1 Tax=Parasphingorhabdus sp. TaxID=2709688 RepID=UPI003298306F